jgi:VanZ family protein
MNYLRPEQPVQASRPSGLSRWLFATYVAALVYASLFPIVGWRLVDGSLFDFLFKPWPRYWTGFDIASNFIAYVPLGVVGLLRAQKTHSIERSVVLATALGLGLSLSMEIIQNYLPSRVPSWVDILFNGLGAFAGACFAAAQTANFAKLRAWQTMTRYWLAPAGRWAGIALLVWTAIQALGQPALFLSGIVPANLLVELITWTGMDQTEAAEWLSQLQLTRMASHSGAILSEIAVVSLNLFVLTTLVLEFTGNRAARLPLGLGLVSFALVLKSGFSANFVGSSPLYWLTIGAQAGLLVGAMAALIAAGLQRRLRFLISAFACVMLILIANVLPLNPFFSIAIHDRHWLSINGTLRHAAVAWPFVMAVICAAIAIRPSRPARYS